LEFLDCKQCKVWVEALTKNLALITTLKNPLGFVLDLSMRVGYNSILRRIDIVLPYYNTTRGYALALVTPPLICAALAVPRTTLNLQAN
jgi:hypothetical protein